MLFYFSLYRRAPTVRLHLHGLLVEQKKAQHFLPFAHHLTDADQLCGHLDRIPDRDYIQTKLWVTVLIKFKTNRSINSQKSSFYNYIL